MDLPAPDHLAPSTTWPGFFIGPDPERIELAQVGERTFVLGSELWYAGDLGVAPANDAVQRRLRSLSPESLESTDLASVPAPFRWWVNTYGRHTPAALIHDLFIGDAARMAELGGLTEQQVDRYFRHMLGTLGVGAPKRWLIWAAVAARTRLVSGWRRRIQTLLWIVLVAWGLCLTVQALRGEVSWWWPLLLPLPSAALWGRQWGAGLMIAYLGVPTLGIPALFAGIGIVQTAVLDAFSRAFRDTADAVSADGREQ